MKVRLDFSFVGWNTNLKMCLFVYFAVHGSGPCMLP